MSDEAVRLFCEKHRIPNSKKIVALFCEKNIEWLNSSIANSKQQENTCAICFKQKYFLHYFSCVPLGNSWRTRLGVRVPPVENLCSRVQKLPRVRGGSYTGHAKE